MFIDWAGIKGKTIENYRCTVEIQNGGTKKASKLTITIIPT